MNTEAHLPLIRVWDFPTRIFHWLFAAATAVAWLTGDEARLTDLHIFCGYLVLALIVFRLVWGFVGGRHARFASFLRGPSLVIAYMRAIAAGRVEHYTGHNPLAAWAVIILMGLNLLLCISGLLVLGAQEGAGPLAGWAGVGIGVELHETHELIAWGILAVIVVHIGAAVVESLRERQNLPAGMIHGRKLGPLNDEESRPALSVALLMLTAVSVYAWFWFSPYLVATEDKPYLPFTGPELTMNATWQESCSECHMAYHPSLLPVRSWNRLLQKQGEHFDEDLALDAETVEQLLRFARENAAEHGVTEVAWRMNHSLSADDTPLRITGTVLWKAIHHELDESVWRHEKVSGKFDCAACHYDAKAGTFNNGAMTLPK